MHFVDAVLWACVCVLRCCGGCRMVRHNPSGCKALLAAAVPPASETRSLTSVLSAGPASACSSPCTLAW